MSKLKIYTRVRPHEKQNFRKRPYNITYQEHNIQLKVEKLNLMNEKKIVRQNFTFDKVFDIDYLNSDIFNEIGFQMMRNLQNGKNSVFYVYGQTGSGKTHTLFGSKSCEVGARLHAQTKGFVELLLEKLLSVNMKVKYQGIQVYNNKCYDIFTHKELKECENHDGSLHFLNGSEYAVEENISELIKEVKESRHVGISSANNQSSRSHLIFQIRYGDHYIKIIDLAGSERASKGQHNEYHNFRENADINLGILAIKECIRNMNKRKIPYRNSKITKILKDTFTNNVNTYILSTISPLASDILDTRDTLKYISDFKQFKKKHKHLPPIETKKRDHINKLNYNLNNELNKEILERSRLLSLIDENIRSLNELKVKVNDI